MQSLDTSVILRLLLLDRPDKVAEINDFIAAQGTGSLLLEDAVLLEVVWILGGPSYCLDRPAVSRALLKIASISQLKCNRALLYKVLPLYVQHPKLSFVDICLATYAELHHAAPLLTFDQALAKQLASTQLFYDSD